MGFLKKLFGGGGAARDGGLYYYVRSRRSSEIIRLRLDPNQLSPEYENERVTGYFAHKTVVGQRSFERLEVELSFSAKKKLIDQSVSGGEFVSREDWIAQQENGLDA
ncbi:hypothetical protein ACFLYO_09425 [Chloroflexota bacterium]